MLALLAVVTIAGAYQGLNLEARYDFRDFLPSGIEETQTTNLLFDEFSFSSESISIYVAGDITDPAVLLAAAEAERLSLQSQYAVLSEQAYTPLSLARSLASPLSPQYAEGFAAWWGEFVDTDGDGQPDSGVGQDTVRELYDRILAACAAHGVRALATRDDHPSGSDRLAECANIAEWADDTVVVNLQGEVVLDATIATEAGRINEYSVDLDVASGLYVVRLTCEKVVGDVASEVRTLAVAR